MFKRPTSRRRSNAEQIQLNLVPILDTMVTLIGFLLFTGTFIALASIESPFPMTSREDVEQQLKEKPLQLTLTLKPQWAEIWSPFDRIAAERVANESEGHPSVRLIHEALVKVKAKFPAERKIVLVPTAGTSYDTLIALMDSIRLLDASDATIYTKNPTTGTDEATKLLFPDVIFGNLLGDS